MWYNGGPLIPSNPASSILVATGASAGGAALTSAIGLTSSLMVIVDSSSMLERIGDSRGAGEMGEKVSLIITSYDGSVSPSESCPESAGELVRTGPLSVTGGDRMGAGGSSLIPLSGEVAASRAGGGAFSNPL